MTGPAGVVVGIDGSPTAAAALMTALEEAARRGETVTAVLAYPAPGSWGATGNADAGEPDRLATAVLEEARRFVDEATMPLPATLREVPLELSVRAGSPAPLLAEAARDAALLVVGHRGRGMVGRAVLGSTACVCSRSRPVRCWWTGPERRRRTARWSSGSTVRWARRRLCAMPCGTRRGVASGWSRSPGRRHRRSWSASARWVPRR